MSTLTELFSSIANAIRSKTGGSSPIKAEDFPSAINGISVGVEGGIIPTGTKSITENGAYDVTSYASANVNVPDKGITPSGTKSITENGTHDVSAYASASVKVEGLNAKILTAIVSADKTSGDAVILSANSYLASLYNDPNTFIMMRYLGMKDSAAMLSFWFSANFPIGYAGSAAKYDIVSRSTASSQTFVAGAGLKVTSGNYSGNLKLGSDGALKVACNASYPLLAGEYQIIAGTTEMI